MTLVNYDFLLRVQEVRKAYLDAEDRDVAARAGKKGVKVKQVAATAGTDGKLRRPAVMTLAPESFMTQFKYSDPT